MNQKIDRVAIAGAAVLILLAIVWSLVGSDPGAASAVQIEKHRGAIDRTLDEQSGIDLGKPADLESEVESRFDLPEVAPFPAWTFYRRPASYWVEIVIEKKPPVLEPGSICKVEVVREKGTPNRVFQRVSGLGGTFERAAIAGQVLERREGKDAKDESGEWVEVGAVAAAESGGAFEVEVAEGLSAGSYYAYRLRTRARSANDLEFAGGGGLDRTVESAPSAFVYVPPDLSWEVSFLQPAQPPMATIVQFTWNWEEMRTKRDQAIVSEKDGKKICGTEFSLDLIRFDKDPVEVILRGGGQTLKIFQGVKPEPLDPKSWESEDSRCTGAGSTEEGTAGAEPPKPEETAPPPKPATDTGAGGLFGGDD